MGRLGWRVFSFGRRTRPNPITGPRIEGQFSAVSRRANTQMANNVIALGQLMCFGRQRGQLGNANGLFGEERNDCNPRADPALFTTHAHGCIPAHSRSCCSPSASRTGVVSASVTRMTLVCSGSRSGMSGVVNERVSPIWRAISRWCEPVASSSRRVCPVGAVSITTN